MVLGSVADRLVRNGTVPVVLIRSTETTTLPERLTNLLVTLDGSELSERALPMATRLARRSGATLHLLRVVEPFWMAPAASYPPEVAWLDTDENEEITVETETEAREHLNHVALYAARRRH